MWNGRWDPVPKLATPVIPAPGIAPGQSPYLWSSYALSMLPIGSVLTHTKGIVVKVDAERMVLLRRGGSLPAKTLRIETEAHWLTSRTLLFVGNGYAHAIDKYRPAADAEDGTTTLLALGWMKPATEASAKKEGFDFEPAVSGDAVDYGLGSILFAMDGSCAYVRIEANTRPGWWRLEKDGTGACVGALVDPTGLVVLTSREGPLLEPAAYEEVVGGALTGSSLVTDVTSKLGKWEINSDVNYVLEQFLAEEADVSKPGDYPIGTVLMPRDARTSRTILVRGCARGGDPRWLDGALDDYDHEDVDDLYVVLWRPPIPRVFNEAVYEDLNGEATNSTTLAELRAFLTDRITDEEPDYDTEGPVKNATLTPWMEIQYKDGSVRLERREITDKRTVGAPVVYMWKTGRSEGRSAYQDEINTPGPTFSSSSNESMARAQEQIDRALFEKGYALSQWGNCAITDRFIYAEGAANSEIGACAYAKDAFMIGGYWALPAAPEVLAREFGLAQGEFDDLARRVERVMASSAAASSVTNGSVSNNKATTGQEGAPMSDKNNDEAVVDRLKAMGSRTVDDLKLGAAFGVSQAVIEKAVDYFMPYTEGAFPVGTPKEAKRRVLGVMVPILLRTLFAAAPQYVPAYDKVDKALGFAITIESAATIKSTMDLLMPLISDLAAIVTASDDVEPPVKDAGKLAAVPPIDVVGETVRTGAKQQA